MPQLISPRQRPHQLMRYKVRRRAAAMAVVLVCLLVIMLMSGTLVRGMLLYHRQAKTESLQLQALWLAESAAALAVAQLRADPEYPGQTWRVSVDENSGSIGVAEIHVVRVDQHPRQRILRIKSTYPDEPIQRVVLDHEVTVTLPVLGDSE
ncbi:MAG: hypothetical protein QF918_15545 [Pirellulaceae bacterium]|nr:hypothetical protein [Pirellulaceae bacterium]